MFSLVTASLRCSRCGRAGDVDVQFKYGNLYSHRYRIGDRIVWGKTQVGDPSERKVAARGLAACPRCGAEYSFDVVIEDGVIVSVTLSTGEYDYHHGEGEYVILMK